ncbi:MAG: TolC family protein [Labilithrix sp.]|nr:TolC family protein [Labilithrix sp.]
MLAPVPRARIEVATWEEALQRVKSLSTDLRIQVATIARAEAASRIALGNALTTINAQGSFTHNLITKDLPPPLQGTTPLQNLGTAGGSLTQPLFNLRSWYMIGTAHRNEEAAQMSYEDTKRVIALNVANAIVGVVTNERVAELNRVGLQNALQRMELTTRKTNLGSGTGLDVVRARQDVETARATLVTGDENLRQAREALGLALGFSEQAGVPPNVDLNGLEQSARSSCKVAETVDQRPDVAALHKRVEIAQRGTTEAKLQFAPSIDLRSSLATSTVQNTLAPATTWNVQGVLTIPIWDGGVRYGNVRDAAAQETIALQNLEAARRKATIEVTQARRAVSVAEESRKVAAAARDLAAETDRLTRTSYLEGRGTSLELVAAAQALRQAEIQLAVQDFNLVKARVAAVLALALCPW